MLVPETKMFLAVAVIVGLLAILGGVGTGIVWLWRRLRRWLGRAYEAGTALQDKIEHERHHFRAIGPPPSLHSRFASWPSRPRGMCHRQRRRAGPR